MSARPVDLCPLSPRCYPRCMVRTSRFLRMILTLVPLLLAVPAHAAKHEQDTGFLNRSVTIGGVTHRYVVYLPENWSKQEKWPVILFLHGSGERGVEGLDQTQIGLPAAIRVHPERWPFVVVMPQVPFSRHHWTDPDMMTMAMTALRNEEREFHGDPDRTYLTGLSLGGYGVWEIAKNNPHTFAAIAPVCGGIFWSYQPSRWNDDDTLPAEYARSLRKVPAWLFHGADDPIVSPRQSELMYDAMKAEGGNVRFWEYEKVKHNVWEKAYAVPELPHWLLSHSLQSDAGLQPASEHITVPVHPVPAHVNPQLYEAYVGDYEDAGVVQVTIFTHDGRLFQRNRVGEVAELLPENPSTFFYLSGSPTRLTFEKDAGTGQVHEILFRDDRHEEHWERRR